MNILLINTNPVVSRLISLCLDDTTTLEEISDPEMIQLDRYDIVFVDDASLKEGVKDILKNLLIRKKVFLSGIEANDDVLNHFDIHVKKPFLPSQISTIINNVLTVNSSMENEVELQETNVLNRNEIEKIKALLEENDVETEQIEDNNDLETRKVEVIKKHLEEDGLEIVSEEEYVETLSTIDNDVKKPKSKSEKRKKEILSSEEVFIAALGGMKVEKLRKLLKGAEITIKIKFKD